MNERRDFLQLAALMSLVAPVALQGAEPGAARGRGEIARFPLGGALAGNDAVLVDLVARPGVAADAGAHRHPGFVLGYVIDGEYAFRINDEETRVIKAGEAFFEEAGTLHHNTGSANPDQPAHFLAFMVVPTGAVLAMPA